MDLVKAGAAALGGQGGGGRPDMAQAGGPDGARAEAGAVELPFCGPWLALAAALGLYTHLPQEEERD